MARYNIKSKWYDYYSEMFVLLHITPLSVDLEFFNPVYGTVYFNTLSSNLIFASGLKLIEKIGEGEQ